MLAPLVSPIYELKGNRVARVSAMEIKQRAQRFCALLDVDVRTRYDIPKFLEGLSAHKICIDPIADKEWLWVTDGCCDPQTLTILVPESTYTAACNGDGAALEVILHEVGHIVMAHRAVLHNEKSAPPHQEEDAEWQADEFAKYVMRQMRVTADGQLSFNFK